MVSHSERYVTVFNGEIYNHLDLRKELEAVRAAPSWRGHSDTETWLAAVDHWGLDTALTKAVGMFAVALWDRLEGALFLARDRLGEKPLYYGWVDGGFVFASELKAFKVLSAFKGAICRRALAMYIQHANVPAPYSIYQGVYKLEPGCVLRVAGPVGAAPAEPLRAPATFGALQLRRWWDLAQVQAFGADNSLVEEGEAIGALDAALRQSIQLQSLADVPVGAFLSGGVDSSLIAALMQQRADRPIKTFTVAFDDPEFDESSQARAVAAHLRTDHTELMVTAADAFNLIPKLPVIYDEPFADASQIPTFFVSQEARRKVTVALSGDAGDELFGGYEHYLRGPGLWSNLTRAPYPARRALGYAVQRFPASAWDHVGTVLNTVLPAGRRIDRFTSKVQTVGALLSGSRSIEELHQTLSSRWKGPAPVLGPRPRTRTMIPPSSPTMDCEQAMMYRDTLDYLPNDILCKVDRAAMANSLETRVPFLDHRVVELAWRLPSSMKIRPGQTKWPLRQILYQHVPRHLIERPKAGFGIPLAKWLRGPLREWAEALLDRRVLEAGCFLDAAPIRRRWEEHLAGTCDHSAGLWTVLMFQAWLENEGRATMRDGS
jgi:asparagine synthase (glutamine-hydrolysing)